MLIPPAPGPKLLLQQATHFCQISFCSASTSLSVALLDCLLPLCIFSACPSDLPPPHRTPLDKSLTSLLTSLLSTLADATTNTTPGAPGSAPSTPSPGTNHSSATNAPGRPTPGPTGTPDGLVQLLTQWADEFLASEGTLPDVKEISGSSPADPADMAKTLFMQLLAELLPPTDSSAPAPSAGQYKDPMQQQQQQQPSLGRGLLAATAAAFTAREAASRLQQRLQAEGSRSTDNTWSVKPAVKRTAGSTTGTHAVCFPEHGCAQHPRGLRLLVVASLLHCWRTPLPLVSSKPHSLHAWADWHCQSTLGPPITTQCSPSPIMTVCNASFWL